MQIATKCKVCEKPFTAIKHTQLFCCRKCFKKDYAIRKRNEMVVENARTKHYIYACALCNHRSEIPFNPMKDQRAAATYICPFCGIPRQTIWEHRYDATFMFGTGTMQYVIQSAIVSHPQPSSPPNTLY